MSITRWQILLILIISNFIRRIVKIDSTLSSSHNEASKLSRPFKLTEYKGNGD